MVKFNAIVSGEIGQNKELVISRRTDGQLSVAQRAIAEVGGREMSVFMKGAVTVDDEGFVAYIGAVVKAGVALGIDVDSLVIAAREQLR